MSCSRKYVNTVSSLVIVLLVGGCWFSVGGISAGNAADTGADYWGTVFGYWLWVVGCGFSVVGWNADVSCWFISL